MSGLQERDLPTNLWVGNGLVDQIEGFLPLPIGTGVIMPDGKRLRVVDCWLSLDRHGHFDLGLHLFLQEVSSEDDRPRRMAPTYFREAPEDV